MPVVRSLIALSLLIILSGWATARDNGYLKDVPEGHFAYDAVYDLIKRGVTGGYPDGTYRGAKEITRYEIAAMLSKLEKSVMLRYGVSEKLLEELKAEAELIRQRSKLEKEESSTRIELGSRLRHARTEARSGGSIAYRLRTAISRKFGEDSGLVINLDTMDAGFGGVSRDLLREMIDVSGKIKTGNVLISASEGPGEVVHRDDGLIPAEDRVEFVRPWRSLAIETTLGRTAFALEYIARASLPTGAVDITEVSARLSQKFYSMLLTLNPRVFYDLKGNRDIRGEVRIDYLGASLTAGAARSSDYPHGLFVKGELRAGDDLKLTAQKIGGQYRTNFNYGILDPFSRDLADGTTNLGVEFKLPLGRDLWLASRQSYTNPGPVNTAEWRRGLRLTEGSDINLVYLGESAKGFSRVLGMEVNLRPQP